MSEGLLLFILIVGGGIWLAFSRPWIFWLIALPVAILAVVAFARWLKR